MTDEPISPEFHRLMNEIAARLDGIFNPARLIGLPAPRVGFLLMTFNLGPGDDRRANYISNCERAETIEALREWLARQEGGNVQ